MRARTWLSEERGIFGARPVRNLVASAGEYPSILLSPSSALSWLFQMLSHTSAVEGRRFA
jgi:hypothetical protein